MLTLFSTSPPGKVLAAPLHGINSSAVLGTERGSQGRGGEGRGGEGRGVQKLY